MSATGQRYAQKFERLLATHPNPNTGKPWRGVEIERATDGFVNSQYVSALRKGLNNRPGLDKLRAIAEVMGFPFDLWLKEPEEWRRTIAEQDSIASTSVADKLNYLFEAIPDEQTGKPLTNEDVASVSQGRLSSGQIEALRSGQRTNPSIRELLALCDVFDVDFSYWDLRRERPPLMDPETLRALRDPESIALLHKSQSIPEDDRGLLMTVIDEMQRRRARSAAQETDDEGAYRTP